MEMVPEQSKSGSKSLQHGGFPGGHPARYWRRPTGLDFGDRTRTGTFPVVWSQTKGAGYKLLHGSNDALSRLEAKQASGLIAVVTKCQLHLGYLTKGLQS